MYVVITNHRNTRDGEPFTLEWKFTKWKDASRFVTGMWRVGHKAVTIEQR